MKNTITVRNQVLIQAPKEEVWNFTQDFQQRKLWDRSVLECEVLQKRPYKLVRLKTLGWLATELKYKLCRKYEKTSLQMINTRSAFIKGGGGSWKYESEGQMTMWTQVNSLTLKNRTLYVLLGKVLQAQLYLLTKASMRKAKKLLES